MWDTVPAWPVYSETTVDRVRDVVLTGEVFDYVGKPPVTRLEELFSTLHGGASTVSFNSGTSALLAAYFAVGVGPGDEVIVPNFTFFATASPLLWVGACPVLVDSAPSEPSISLDAIAAAVTPRTRAVVVTHLFGYPVDIVPIADFCRSRGLRLIEDCSHAHASRIGSRHVGTFGDAAAYSLGAGKMISGGHGGMLVAGDEVVHDLAMLTGHSKPRTRHDLRTMMLRRYAEFALGGNLRMSPFAAVLALDHAERLDDLSAHRLHNVAVLDAALEGLLDTIDVPPDRFNGSFFDMVYTLPASAPTAMRDVLVAELRRAGVPVTAPATRLLNRVIGSTCTGGPRLDHPLVRRLNELAENLPDAAELAHSIDLHDRMVSFPAGRLYAADGELAAWMALRARPVIARVLEST